MEINSILFDFDGTLADTMPNHYMAWKEVLADYDKEISETDYYPLEGFNLIEIAKKLGPSSPTEGVINQIVKRKKEVYVHICRANPPKLYDGVQSLLEELTAKNFRFGIVTAGHLDQLKATIPDEFLNMFSAIVTGDSIIRGKPHPDPYIEGKKKLRTDNSSCIAIENAPIGIISAVNSGLYCIAISSTVQKEKLCLANEVISKFSELKKTHILGKFF